MRHKLATNALNDGETAELVHITAAWNLTDTLRKRNNTGARNDGGNGPKAR